MDHARTFGPPSTTELNNYFVFPYQIYTEESLVTKFDGEAIYIVAFGLTQNWGSYPLLWTHSCPIFFLFLFFACVCPCVNAGQVACKMVRCPLPYMGGEQPGAPVNPNWPPVGESHPALFAVLHNEMKRGVCALVVVDSHIRSPPKSKPVVTNQTRIVLSYKGGK